MGHPLVLGFAQPKVNNKNKIIPNWFQNNISAVREGIENIHREVVYKIGTLQSPNADHTTFSVEPIWTENKCWY